MLIEIRSKAFEVKGKIRPPITFKAGLNVILGGEDGENSIRKSSALLAIDFAFGGNTYVKSDAVKQAGGSIRSFSALNLKVHRIILRGIQIIRKQYIFVIKIIS